MDRSIERGGEIFPFVEKRNRHIENVLRDGDSLVSGHEIGRIGVEKLAEMVLHVFAPE